MQHFEEPIWISRTKLMIKMHRTLQKMLRDCKFDLVLMRERDGKTLKTYCVLFLFGDVKTVG